MRHEVCWWGEADQADLTPWPGLALQEERSAAVEEAGSCCVVPLWTGADEISRGVAGVATGTREGEGALKHVLWGPTCSEISAFPLISVVILVENELKELGRAGNQQLEHLGLVVCWPELRALRSGFASELEAVEGRSSELCEAEQECRRSGGGRERRPLHRGDLFERLEALAERGAPELRQMETELRRAVAAHRYVVRHMVPEPGRPAAAPEAAAETVRRCAPVSGGACEDFLFVAPARRVSGSRVAWLRGEEKGTAEGRWGRQACAGACWPRRARCCKARR